MVTIIALFLIASIVFAITGNSDLAHSSIGTATGIAIGSGGAVAITVNANRPAATGTKDDAGKAA